VPGIVVPAGAPDVGRQRVALDLHSSAFAPRLPPHLEALTTEIVRSLRDTPGLVALALGGSYAAGMAHPDSDLDFGLYYRDEAPLDLEVVRRVAEALNDVPAPTVTGFGGWGKWVNGGAWLTVRGQRVDFIYRSVDRLRHWIARSREGDFEQDYYVQHAYGFRSYMYLGELHICRPLLDSDGALAALKAEVAVYPPALKAAVIRTWLPNADTSYSGRKAALRGDVYMAVGCFTRSLAMLAQVLFALNERYFVTDKGTLDHIKRFALAPPGYAERAQEILARPGSTPEALMDTERRLEELQREVALLCTEWMEEKR
jgi:predicted nucleotidyltransferase